MTTPVVPDSARAPDTPPDVVIRMNPREPDRDPTLGIVVPAPASTSRPLNRLVTIGDSLTHGFQSAAIFNTKLSWPTIVAWEMGWDDHFRFPTYDGFGGLPFNLEFIIRDLDQRYGDKINWWKVPLAAFHLNHAGAEIRHWWENGSGSVIPKRAGIMHNLAVFGWDLRDALSRDANNLEAVINGPPPSGLHLAVSHAGERAAMEDLRRGSRCRRDSAHGVSGGSGTRQAGWHRRHACSRLISRLSVGSTRPSIFAGVYCRSPASAWGIQSMWTAPRNWSQMPAGSRWHPRLA